MFPVQDLQLAGERLAHIIQRQKCRLFQQKPRKHQRRNARKLTRPNAAFLRSALCRVIDAVAGCEEHNLDYFLRAGMAVTADTPEKIADLALSLAHDEARLSSMRNAMQESTARPAAEAIYAWLQAHR